MHGARKKQEKKLHLLNIKKVVHLDMCILIVLCSEQQKKFQKAYFLEHSGPTAVLNLAVLVFN